MEVTLCEVHQLPRLDTYETAWALVDLGGQSLVEVRRSSSCLPVSATVASFTFIHFHSLSTFGKTQFLCIAFTEERLKEAKQILQAEITMGLGNQVWRTAKVTIWPRDKRMIALTVG